MSEPNQPPPVPPAFPALAAGVVLGLAVLGVALIAWRGQAILLDLSAIAVWCF
jgi:hypothetical protein